MFWSKNNTFKKDSFEVKVIKQNMVKLLELKKRSDKDINLYLEAFTYFEKYPTKFDGATIVKDLDDLPNLDLDAMVHDYEYLNGANRSFIKKWKADIRYIKNMEANGKGIRVFRLLLLTIIGIIFVPYCYIKYKLN